MGRVYCKVVHMFLRNSGRCRPRKAGTRHLIAIAVGGLFFSEPSSGTWDGWSEDLPSSPVISPILAFAMPSRH